MSKVGDPKIYPDLWKRIAFYGFKNSCKSLSYPDDEYFLEVLDKFDILHNKMNSSQNDEKLFDEYQWVSFRSKFLYQYGKSILLSTLHIKDITLLNDPSDVLIPKKYDYQTYCEKIEAIKENNVFSSNDKVFSFEQNCLDETYRSLTEILELNKGKKTVPSAEKIFRILIQNDLKDFNNEIDRYTDTLESQVFT